MRLWVVLAALALCLSGPCRAEEELPTEYKVLSDSLRQGAGGLNELIERGLKGEKFPPAVIRALLTGADECEKKHMLHQEGGLAFILAFMVTLPNSKDVLIQELEAGHQRQLLLAAFKYAFEEHPELVGAIAQLVERTKDEALKADCIALLGFAPAHDEKQQALLVKQLDDLDPGIQTKAAAALCTFPLKDKALVERLVAIALASKIPSAQDHMAGQLAQLSEHLESIRGLLEGALSAENPAMRSAAVRLLFRMQPFRRELSEKLAQIASNPQSDDELRLRAVMALDRCGIEDGKVLEALTKALLDKGSFNSIQSAAAFAVAHLKRPPQESLQALILVCQNFDPQEKDVSILQTQREARRWAAKAIGNIGPDAKDAVPALIKLLDDDSRYVRIFAAQALGAIGPEAKAALPRLALAPPFDPASDMDSKAFAEAIQKIDPDYLKDTPPPPQKKPKTSPPEPANK